MAQVPFSATGSVAAARTDQTAALLPDGRVFIFGGAGGDSTPLASGEV
jgi:hypothetical protein